MIAAAAAEEVVSAEVTEVTVEVLTRAEAVV
jgi:hypothetical protein